MTATTGTVHWRWNETDVSQFDGQFNLGPVTGTVTLSYKPATGSHMSSPSIRAEFSDAFHTPSGSMAIFKIKDLELPKNFRLRFFSNHFSTSNNVASTSARYGSLLFGFLLNASSGTQRSDYCGTFYANPFYRDYNCSPKPVNAGHRNAGLDGGSWSNRRVGMYPTQHTLHDWFFKHLSITGSILSGTDVELYTHKIMNTDYDSSQYTSLNYTQTANVLHWSGSAFSGKILTNAYLAFSYDPPSVNYSPITGTYVEFDNLIFLKHPAGNGREIQPPPLTTSMASGTSEPPILGSSLTYWTTPSGNLVTVAGGRVTKLDKFSGSQFTFGNVNTAAPYTSSLLVNGTTYPTLYFSGGGAVNSFLTSTTSDAGYVSGSAYRTYYVLNIETGSLNSATRYSNHIIHGDTAGYWGVYFRNNGNGSGTLDGYGYVSSGITASVEFKFGETVLLEYWRDATSLYVRLNNTGSVVSASIGGAISVGSGAPSQMAKTGDVTSRWHLIEMVTSNANTTDTTGTLGVANYLSQKYGFATRSTSVAVGGEIW